MKYLIRSLHIISWIPIFLIHTVFILVGIFTVPIGLMIWKNAYEWRHPLWLWGNDEEGVPDWWLNRCSNMRPSDADSRLEEWLIRIQRAVPKWWWLAIRNPVNNFRFLFNDYDPSEVNVESNWSLTEPMEALNMLAAKQRSAYRWVWRGPFASYRRVWLNDNNYYSEFWIGWKIGSDVPGLGFTSQFRYKAKVGQ